MMAQTKISEFRNIQNSRQRYYNMFVIIFTPYEGEYATVYYSRPNLQIQYFN